MKTERKDTKTRESKKERSKNRVKEGKRTTKEMGNEKRERR